MGLFLDNGVLLRHSTPTFFGLLRCVLSHEIFGKLFWDWVLYMPSFVKHHFYANSLLTNFSRLETPSEGPPLFDNGGEGAGVSLTPSPQLFLSCSPILQLLLQLLLSSSDLLASQFRDSKDTVSGISLILVGGCQRLIVCTSCLPFKSCDER